MEDIPLESATGPDKTGFRSAWIAVFNGTVKECMTNIRKMAFSGELSDCPFRSVVWKLLLEVLPQNPKQWMRTSSFERSRYEKAKEKYVTDIFLESTDNRVGKPTNFTYKDSDLRREIEQDVMRTFPEMEFFTDPKITSMMCAILFVYAKENSDVLYKQGMHELLAIIIYVLDKDHTAFKRCIKSKTKMSDRVHTVVRGSYIEHDAFLIFSKVMQHTKVWYEYKESAFQQFKFRLSQFSDANSGSDIEFNSPAIKKINYIWDKKIKHYDPEVHYKLNSLDIQPHFFSLRWLRLLFARELPFEEVLNLWDAMFAYDSALSLVDSIFSAILLSIRDELVVGEHTSCLQSLMRHPKKISAFKIIPWALYIADSGKFPRPLGFIDRTNWVPPSKTSGAKNFKVGVQKKAGNFSPKQGRSYSLTNLFNAVMGNKDDDNADKEELASDNNKRRGSHQTVAKTLPMDLESSRANKTYQTTANEDLQIKHNELTANCKFCSKKLDVFIQSLHEVLSEENLKNDDKILISIAGLKQVRDILNGSIKCSTEVHKEEPKRRDQLNKQHESQFSNKSSEDMNVCKDQKVVLNGAVTSKSPHYQKLSVSTSPVAAAGKGSLKIKQTNNSKKLLLPDKSLTGVFSPSSQQIISNGHSSSPPCVDSEVNKTENVESVTDAGDRKVSDAGEINGEVDVETQPDVTFSCGDE